MRTIAALVLTATLTAGAVPAVAGTAEPSTLQQDLAQLLDGVHEIAAPGAPGNLVVFGDAAFPVVVGRSGRSGRGVVVSAGRFGKGRVVAFSHNGYFGNEALAVGDTSRFMANAVRWAAGGRAATTPKLRVGLYRERDLVEFFEDNGFKAAEADLHRLNALQVLVANAHSFSEKDIEPLTKFVQSGGGLVTGSCGWGWAQLNPAKDLRCDFAGNRLLAPMGMVWGSGTLERTGPRGFAAGETPPRTLHAGWASQSALAQIEGRSVLSAADSDQASATITAAARALPPDDKVFLPKLGQLARSDKTPVMPTPGAPIKKSDLAARLAATFQAMTAKMLPPEQVKAHPAARIFPGEVPAGAPRSTRKLDMDTRVPGWHSTGLYAPPGEVVTVQVPDAAAGKGFWFRIGAHSDHLWDLDPWQRFPEISMRVQLDRTMTRIASMFGGLIYVESPNDCAPGNVPVEIQGAVAAPCYVLGKTSAPDWQRLREAPAPWAELAGAKIIVTVPSEFVRKLNDPEPLMKTWDRIVELQDELAGTTAERRRPERIVCDQQISAGYMHAGYPIMAWMDQAKNFTSRESLLKGNWGIFHELGHNHQSGHWTFDGAGEVTCNLFTVYVMDKLCGVPPAKGRVNLEKVAGFYEKHAAGGKSFEQWKQDPFLALAMYVQLQDAFGWEAFKKVFAEYRAAPKDELPKNDGEKRDQWLVRFSKTVGKNLGPFFQAWGIPVSQSALDDISRLPAWMPADFPPKL